MDNVQLINPNEIINYIFKISAPYLSYSIHVAGTLTKA